MITVITDKSVLKKSKDKLFYILTDMNANSHFVNEELYNTIPLFSTVNVESKKVKTKNGFFTKKAITPITIGAK